MASTLRCAGGRSEHWRPTAGAARRWLATLALLGFAALPWAQAQPTAGAAAPPSALDCASAGGPLRLAAEALARDHARAEPGPVRARAAAALGQAYLRLNRLAEAEALLLEAEAGLPQPRERAAAALARGNLHLARRQPEAADAAWLQALDEAPGHPDLALAVELNRLRLGGGPQRLPRLLAASRQVDALPAGPERTRLTLNIAAQAKGMGAEGVALAAQRYELGRAEASAAGEHALAAEAYDGLGALYEDQQRLDEALQLSEQGLWHAQQGPARELAVPLEWRAARVLLRQGRRDAALAALRRAVAHIEAVRSDIPVQYQDGRSSFRETLEPVYLGLTDLLLQQSASSRGDVRATLLRQARDTVELIKQTELEDYLRDRCTVGASRSDARVVLPPGTAIYYPIILPDRLELLVETAQGIERTSVPVSGDELRRAALNFVSYLRARSNVRTQAENLYRWLLAPIEEQLARHAIQTLVVVPDGVLRLVPMGALHDGRDYVIHRLAVATAPGLSLAALPRREPGPLRALLAGLSEPGPVVDKLSAEVVDIVLDNPADTVLARGGAAPGGTDVERAQARSRALREALALPGVKRELADIGGAIDSTALLDQAFTLAALREHLLSRDYPVVHIASHGVFGDSADTTFIMTYDELLTLDGLQQLLGAERFRTRPIELLTLSACQTAEGDDRAPLGMSGTAIKARARSALGTLWPVSDSAAQQLMSGFYQRLGTGQQSKVGALRAAQIELIGNPRFRHPFYWAPFTLIGDWQ
jgi:CHAT domain-containing protein